MKENETSLMAKLAIVKSMVKMLEKKRSRIERQLTVKVAKQEVVQA